MSSIAVVAVTAMTMVAFSPLASVAGAAPGETSTCRGSAVKLTTPILSLEPVVVQNAPGQPCTNQSKTLIGPINVPGLINVSVGNASTKVSGTANHPVTTAQVTGLSVSVAGLITVSADVISAQTSAGKCTGTFGTPSSHPTLTSSGQIANLVVNGGPINVGSQPATIPILGIATLELNKVTTNNTTSIQRQALVLSVPALGIQLVLSSAQSGFAGNPCDG